MPPSVAVMRQVASMQSVIAPCDTPAHKNVKIAVAPRITNQLFKTENFNFAMIKVPLTLWIVMS